MALVRHGARAPCRNVCSNGNDHHIVFFERDVPYYASNRDLVALPGGELVFYDSLRPTRTGLALFTRATARHHRQQPRSHAMKIILWIVAIIFLIGLAVVIGTGKLIF